MQTSNKTFYTHIVFVLLGGFLFEVGILILNTTYKLPSLLLMLIGGLLLVKGIRKCIL